MTTAKANLRDFWLLKTLSFDCFIGLDKQVRIQQLLKWNAEATIGVKFGIGPVSPGEQSPVTALGNCFNCPLPSICELGKRGAVFENLSCDTPQPFVRANVKTKAHSRIFPCNTSTDFPPEYTAAYAQAIVRELTLEYVPRRPR